MRTRCHHSRFRSSALLLLCLLSAGSVRAAARVSVGDARTFQTTVRPLHRRLGAPAAGEWRALYREPGQSFEEYRALCRRVGHVRTRTRYVIDVLPLGAVGDVDWIRLRATAKFLRLYYGVPVRLLGPVPLAGLPAEASRSGPGGERQYAAPYLLERVIRPRLRRDTMACLAMTNVDLVPGPGWGRIKYLYGFAAVDARVAIASAYRCRSAEQDRRGRREELRRILKTAAHEVGHVLRIPHCTSWACNMNGQNSRFEMDRRPLWLCPDCAAKIAWASQIEPAERYRRLEAFCRDHDLEEEAAFYRRSREALEFRLARRDGSRPVASRERAARPTLLERVGESLLGWR